MVWMCFRLIGRGSPSTHQERERTLPNCHRRHRYHYSSPRLSTKTVRKCCVNMRWTRTRERGKIIIDSRWCFAFNNKTYTSRFYSDKYNCNEMMTKNCWSFKLIDRFNRLNFVKLIDSTSRYSDQRSWYVFVLRGSIDRSLRSTKVCREDVTPSTIF